jgi:hypothetical protein
MERLFISFDQDVQVCGIFFSGFLNSFVMPLSLSLFCFETFESMGYLYSFLSFFWLMLLWHGIFSLCCFVFLSCSLAWKYFFHSPYSLFGKDEEFGEREREVHNTSDGVFILVDGKACFYITLSVRVSILFVGVRES